MEEFDGSIELTELDNEINDGMPCTVSSYLYESTKKPMLSTFLETMQSEKTKKVYTICINSLCEYLQKDFTEITREDADSVWDYLTLRINRGEITKQTAKMRFSCYNSFAIFIIENFGAMEINPFALIVRPIVSPQTSQKYIPEFDDIDKILSAAKNDSQFYVILLLVFRMGLSASEVLELTKADLRHTEDGAYNLYIKGKTDAKCRYMIVPGDIVDVVVSYFNLSNGEYLFFNKYKNKLTLRNLETLTQKYCIAAKLDRTYSIKDIRNRSIMELCRTGLSVDEIATYTGLSSLRVRTFVETAGKQKNCPADMVNFSYNANKSSVINIYADGFINALKVCDIPMDKEKVDILINSIVNIFNVSYEETKELLSDKLSL